MIYRLEIENFYCIRDRQILDLTVPRTTPDSPERFAPIFEGSEIRAPKVVAIYGANGSGKSTVLRALALVAWFVKDSFQNSAPGIPCQRFNDEESANRPVGLAIEFGYAIELSKKAVSEAAEGHAVRQCVYRYELELGTKDGVVVTVNKEVLRQKRGGRGKWLRVFERKVGNKLLGSSVFSLSGYANVIDKIRDNASVVATLALFEHEPSQVLVAAAESVLGNILTSKMDLSDSGVIQYLAENPNVVDELNKELQRIDVGIQKMEIVQTRNGHPLILPEILRWYYDPVRNAYDAQLWMTCHSASLMDDLMKEEIVLCEKDRQGRSEIFALTDMKAVRRSDNLYKKYLGGVYGAVPHIG
jgi:AAA15 family ATPase/GTPase